MGGGRAAADPSVGGYNEAVDAGLDADAEPGVEEKADVRKESAGTGV